MTLLVSWLGVDSRAPSSLYMMSESRISWKQDKNTQKWDYGKKVFSFRNSPDIMGYCGDVLFPMQVINHVINMADNGIIFKPHDSEDKRFERIKYLIKDIIEPYPKNNLCDSFTILYGTRISKSEFSCFKLNWENGNKWSDSKISYTDYSDKLFVLGSGKDEFLQNYKKYQNSSDKRTSRAIYHCFCHTIDNIQDDRCGGAPQLVGLYRIYNGLDFGIIYNGKRYLSGVQIDNLANFEHIEWRNELFERFDGTKKRILPNAQKQPNVLISTKE